MRHVPSLGRVEVLEESAACMLRTKSFAERIAMTAAANRTARLLIAAGVRASHPDWSEKQVRHEVVRRMTRGSN